jgi:hypothetical protein
VTLRYIKLLLYCNLAPSVSLDYYVINLKAIWGRERERERERERGRFRWWTETFDVARVKFQQRRKKKTKKVGKSWGVWIRVFLGRIEGTMGSYWKYEMLGWVVLVCSMHR